MSCCRLTTGNILQAIAKSMKLDTSRRLKQLCDRGVLKREIRDGVYFYTGTRRSTTI